MNELSRKLFYCTLFSQLFFMSRCIECRSSSNSCADRACSCVCACVRLRARVVDWNGTKHQTKKKKNAKKLSNCLSLYLYVMSVCMYECMYVCRPVYVCMNIISMSPGNKLRQKLSYKTKTKTNKYKY